MEVLRSKQPRDIMSELAKPFSFGLAIATY
jgi:hypothetical protein